MTAPAVPGMPGMGGAGFGSTGVLLTAGAVATDSAAAAVGGWGRVVVRKEGRAAPPAVTKPNDASATAVAMPPAKPALMSHARLTATPAMHHD